MAKPHTHAIVGALAALAPDVMLLLFGWRKDWLPESDWRVRAHRFLHSPQGIVVALVLGWCSHVILDRYSRHREGP